VIYSDDNIIYALEKVAAVDGYGSEEKAKLYARIGTAAGILGVPFGSALGAAIGAKEGRRLPAAGGAFIGEGAGLAGGLAAGGASGVAAGALARLLLRKKPNVSGSDLRSILGLLGAGVGGVGGAFYGSGKGAAWGHRGFKSKKKKGMKKRASVEVYSDDNIHDALEKMASASRTLLLLRRQQRLAENTSRSLRKVFPKKKSYGYPTKNNPAVSLAKPPQSLGPLGARKVTPFSKIT
jgi:hypothetical protein